jgi:ABC-type glycerol-3-phosphate transport system substrate-binding protein
MEEELGSESFEGVTLTLLIHPTLYMSIGGDTGIVSEFEAATGAKVLVVRAAIPEYVEKAMLDFISGRGGFDVMNVAVDHIAQFPKFIKPLDELIAQDAEEMEWDDFVPQIVEWFRIDDRQVGVPYRVVPRLFYYRNDLLLEAGVAVPTTLDELIEAARTLSKDTTGDGKIDHYGIVLRGKAPSELSNDWFQFFVSAGGTQMDEAGKSSLLSPPGIYTAEWFRDLYQEGILPEDVFAWGRDDVITAFQMGRASTSVMTAPYYQRLFGGDAVLKQNQIGWAVSPTAPGVPKGRSFAGGWCYAINKDTKNFEAAWELTKILTSKANQVRCALEWANGPVRISTMEHADYKKKWPQAAEILQALNTAVIFEPALALAEPQLIVSTEITAVMQGTKSPQEALADADKEINRILAQ